MRKQLERNLHLALSLGGAYEVPHGLLGVGVSATQPARLLLSFVRHAALLAPLLLVLRAALALRRPAQGPSRREALAGEAALLLAAARPLRRRRGALAHALFDVLLVVGVGRRAAARVALDAVVEGDDVVEPVGGDVEDLALAQDGLGGGGPAPGGTSSEDPRQ